ncbi:MDR family MFS transporter [Sphaerobacter thermophilus]|jgi:EmrB/QacA subfamily drug resistance transporter|uniref:Drug resistance transporter, EmrB/QacA subfamily n=1 Tax=Sphaerobacter thermophilus (strain ATCC 49802 / DSM 20745 / KCCM 41009 / NCIMB 13125 / S 6022) TaxID=479434 RepID=D1C610_SPHTD|nr:MDR family MFS transporter [Sphaerobacter thermophilus]ACZ39562.1 drug resistance transporter, EmrB/QacA subfamily [Sphaerobacter thermophilus DSM 20745]
MIETSHRAAGTETTQSVDESVDKRRLVFIVIGVLLGMLLGAVDQTVVGTAMPQIIADLHGLQHYAWVFTAYMLASTVSVPIYGKLSDIYGRRGFFLLGMILFLAGSALSGMSQTMTQLILFRGLQGLGAGAMLPIAIAIIGDVFPPSERGKWQGLMGAVFGLASIIGPTLGGWITDNWGWPWVFYVNMPIGAVALLTAGLAIPATTRRRQHRIDYVGATLLVLGTVPLLLAFTWGGETYPWGSVQIIGMLAFATVALVAAFIWESRVEEPIISPGLFKNSVFTVSVLASFLASAGMFGAVMYLPLFIQGVVGNSATNSGVVLTPMMLGFIASSIVGGQLLSRTGKYKVLSIVSFAVGAVGAFLLSQMDTSVSNGVVVRNMVIIGLGIGVSMSLFTIITQNAFPIQKLGEVTASLQFFRSIGGTIGVAVLGTVMTNRYNAVFASNIPAQVREQLTPEQLAALQNPQGLMAPETAGMIQQMFAQFGAQGQEIFAQVMLAIRESLATAITDLFVVTTIALVLATVSCFFLKEIPLRKTNRVEASAEAAQPEEVAEPPAPVGADD